MRLTASFILYKYLKMSCLFNSLSTLTPEIDSLSLRNKICDFLLLDKFEKITLEEGSGLCAAESNEVKPSMVAELEGMSLSTYVDKMRNPGTWGGALEILAYVYIYKTNVSVVNIRDKNTKDIEFVLEGNQKTVKISWNGGHYEPIV
jgi:hypothetical protein